MNITVDIASSDTSISSEEVFFFNVDNNSPPSQVLLHIRGAVDISALKQALMHLIERHEILRTYFVFGANSVLRRISPAEPDIFLKEQILLNTTEPKESLIEKFCVTDLAFDRHRPPLFRATIIQHADDDFTLILTCHHILGDAVSKSILLEELGELYQSYATSVPSALAPLTMQYSDYVRWQEQQRDANYQEELTAYWQERLSDIPPLLFPRPQHEVDAEDRFWQLVPLEIPDDLFEEIQSWCKTTRSTIYIALLSVWTFVLARHLGANDLIVICPFSTRKNSNTQRMPGCFVNPLALRNQVSWDETFSSHAQEVRYNFLDDCENADFPISNLLQLVHEMKLDPSTIFQLILTLLPKETELQIPGASVEHRGQLLKRHLGNESNKTLIDFTLWESDTGLSGTIAYNPFFLSRQVAEQMAVNFIEYLWAAMKDPERLLSQIVEDSPLP